MPPAESPHRSGGPGACIPARSRGPPVPQCAEVLVGRLVISRYLPSVSSAQRDARRRLPSRGSRGPWFPTFVGPMLRSDCHHALLGSLRSSLASRYLACFRPFVVSPRGSWRGGSLHATPGPLVTRGPPPGMWQGDRWLSHVPELPLCMHAPL